MLFKTFIFYMLLLTEFRHTLCIIMKNSNCRYSYKISRRYTSLWYVNCLLGKMPVYRCKIGCKVFLKQTHSASLATDRQKHQKKRDLASPKYREFEIC